MKTTRTIFFILFLILPLQIAVAQLSFKYKSYEQKWSRGLRYGFFKPENYDPNKAYPLVLYLHGANDTISRDITWYHESIQRENPLFVLTPKCSSADQGWGNTWTEGHSTAMRATLQILDSLLGKYNIDKNRLYIYGISMGGFGVFSALAKESGKFAAGYAICGGSSETVASKLLDTPLWIFHADADDVVGVQYSRQIYQQIKKQGGKVVRYTEYAGVRHNSWENVSRERTLHRWLLAQAKGKTAASPVQPDNLQAILDNEKNIKLRWPNATGRKSPDQEVWFYQIFKDDKLLKEIDGGESDFTDTSVNEGISYQYHIKAINYNFKESKPSSTVSMAVP